MLSGPKGAGKTTLAERIPALLPDLSPQESLELTAIHSLAGALEPGDDMFTRPPFFAPHHDASKASLLGGGTGRVRPGEVSRAHCGVLFLDEFPLFRTDVIEALRQPLESGEVTIARGEESATFPARGMVVVASNPCPCGDYHPDARQNRCTCRGGEATRLPQPDHRARSPTGSTSSGTSLRSDRTTATRWPCPRRPQRSGHGWSVARLTPGGALHRSQLAAQRPGAGAAAARGVAAHRRRPAPRRRPAVLRAGSAGAARRGSTGWPGRWPTWPASPGPDVDEADTALRLRSGQPLLLAALSREAG